MDPNSYYYSESERTHESWQWRSTPHSPKLQYWYPTIRWLRVMSRKLIRVGSLPLCNCTVGVFYSPSWQGRFSNWFVTLIFCLFYCVVLEKLCVYLMYFPFLWVLYSLWFNELQYDRILLAWNLWLPKVGHKKEKVEKHWLTTFFWDCTITNLIV